MHTGSVRGLPPQRPAQFAPQFQPVLPHIPARFHAGSRHRAARFLHCRPRFDSRASVRLSIRPPISGK